MKDMIVRLLFNGDASRMNAVLRQSESRLKSFGGAARREFDHIRSAANSLQGKLAALGISVGAAMLVKQSAELDKSLTRIGQTAGESRVGVTGLRREFFRIPYTTPLKYYEISEQTAQMQTTEELFTEIQKPEYIDQVREGTIQNISGGGIRFVSGQWIKQNQNILLVIRLTNEYSDETFYLPGQVIATEKHPAIEEMYIHRVKFLFRDLRDREKIVRFVFEEERRIRRKEVG